MKKLSTLFWLLSVLFACPMATFADEAVFNFAENTFNLPVGEGTDFAQGQLSGPVTVGDVTLTGVQGAAAYQALLIKNNDGTISFNVYKNGAIKFTAASGKAITKISATMRSKTFDMMSPSTGTITENEWNGNASEVTFQASALMSFYKFVITTDEENSETVKPKVETFDVEVDNIADFNSVEDGKIVKLHLNNARVNGYLDLRACYYVEDQTGAVSVQNASLTVGSLLSGYVIGTKNTDNDIDYMGVTPAPVEYQLVATDASEVKEQTTVLQGTVTALSEVGKQENFGKLITVEDVEISGSGQAKTLKDAEGNTIKARDYMGVLSDDFSWPEKASKITGVVIYYMTAWFLMPISDEAIVPASDEMTTAVFDFANNNIGLTPGSNGDHANDGNLENVALNIDDVTMTFVSSPTMPTRYYNLSERGDHFQMIKDGQVRITAKEGYAITGVRVVPSITTNQSTGALETRVNWKVDKGEGTLAADNLSWTGNAASVRFTGTGATYVETIEVDMAPETAETVVPTPNEYTSEVTTLAEFNELADGTLVKLSLTDAVVTSGMVNEWGFYLQDATAGAHFYCTGINIPVGSSVNGTVYVKKSKQTMGARIAMTEETNDTELVIAENGEYEPITGSILDVNKAENKLMVVKLTGVAVAGTEAAKATVTDQDGNTITINNGKTNYFPYVWQEDLSTVNLTKATVVGLLYGSNATTNMIMPLSIENEETTEIADVNVADQDEVVIYNLQGMRLTKPQQGINIINGKKIIVK